MRQWFTAFFPILWLLHSFGSPLLGCFLSLEGTVIWMSFEGWALSSHLSSVTIWPLKSALAITHCKEKLWPGLRITLISVYKHTYLEGSMSPFLFSKIIVASPLGLVASQPWDFDQSQIFLIMEQKVEMLSEWALGSTRRFAFSLLSSTRAVLPFPRSVLIRIHS